MNDEAKEIVLETEDLLTILLGKLQDWVTGFVEMLPNLVVAVVVVVLSALTSRLLATLVHRAAERAGNAQLSSLLSVSTRIAVLSAGLFVALGILQLEKTVTSLLAGIGVVGLALGFAFQDIASNFMSGVIMALREPFRVGDLVETHGTMGFVERVTLRATVVRNFWGQIVILPNKDVLQSPIVNFTQLGKRRVEVPVGVSYADDLERAAQVAREALEALPDRDDSQPVDVYWTGFGDSSIDLSARFWIDLGDQSTSYLDARSNAVMAIKRAFDDADITIPFPIRTLDFGDDVAEVSAKRASAGDGRDASAPAES